ncbi:cell division protein FtsZ [Candidatus Nomurabacteria bacterium RIFOXYC2_FULL_36_19]|uniref:Cell division protein FtsZ n=3 Tax=Candidatus Nomuraibacteriota TaxID=1752729 RepID=A0A1F6YW44_9BACT|nr:MAG: Cell division protein ftsZ [Candidatus Nomurabacteria bacterium GW2011_GWC2_35_8]OGJ05492.1 MAG: cell division protein FtsZ [Candidatus Nomurabacteria bacterium RIFOXYA2_FULL_35_9]OGJ06499.1 MAG: cell division protein FtsZ [Candidatus Nomurabacteria bacterium RIFOXYA1_FULL_35_17]OGJ10577.1 MAG: cell division protein FtsZ [Candidatus Nomurabacteria bacterium RIFOXYC2_FULL_36_19]OGJ15107.1 MAG: cell division protein FtsZ [Candidatus Nomurabacteria bacterium RIFOXYD2_FULL_35_12]
MPKINQEIETFARIMVIGIGGSGKNAINHMINSKVKGVSFICMNTDTQDLHHSLADKKIHIGKNLTKGLGAGMDPEVGKKAAEETKSEIQDVIKGADMIFLACGMGGGTGTGAAPIVARAAKEQGILTIAVTTKPFFFEGNHRMKIAEKGIEELSKEVDAIIIIPNDKLLQLADKNTNFKDAFASCDNVLRQAVEGISDLITTPGIINVDFADIKAVMRDAGSALMGIGTASGEKRAEKAALAAINSPLLEISIHGAKGVLFAISGGDDLTIHEIQEAAKIITESIDKDAKVIFGTIRDEKLKKGELKVTVIATNFPTDMPRKSLFSGENVMSQTFLKEDNANSAKKEINNSINSAKGSTTVNNNDFIKKMDNKKTEPIKDIIIEDDTDDWSAVPAFLRRKK